MLGVINLFSEMTARGEQLDVEILISSRNCMMCDEATFESDCLSYGLKSDAYCAFLPLPKDDIVFASGNQLL